jgi:hypothetical protein
MNQFPWQKLIRPLFALLLLVIGCAVTARFLAGEETLAEYAEQNPELAYGAEEEQTDEVPDEAEALYDAAEDLYDQLPDAVEEELQQEAGDVLQEAQDAVTQAAEEKSPVVIRKESESKTSSGAGSSAKKKESAASAGAGTGNSKNSKKKQSAASGSSAERAGSGASSGATESRTAEEASSAATTGASGDSAEDKRVVYEDGFFYEPIPDDVYERMLDVSYPSDCPVSLDSLRYLNILYIDFDDREQVGELVCNESIAQDLLEIFYDLYRTGYQLESVRLVDDFDGDDDASMLANNTSCFNYRTVAGTNNLSKHALGLAVDINPLYNPWVNGGEVTLPEAAEYADRSLDFEHKIDENDYCCQCFLDHDFFWGGNWNNPDYQHFQRN